MHEEEAEADNSSAIKVNWDLDNYEEVNRPVVYGYEYDMGSLLEGEPDYLDFVPTSAFRKDLEFQELSALNCSTPSDLTLTLTQGTGMKQEKHSTDDPNNEPCEAAVAIAANIPTPEPKTVSSWRTFISTAYYHPNVLVHKDVGCLKDLFQLLGSDIHFENANFMIEFGKSNGHFKPLLNFLRPSLPTSQPAPLLTFAHIKEFSIETELKTCIVRKYNIMAYMKRAVSELVKFITDYPEALYLEAYGFILDFFLQFGVQPDVIIDAVMRTQSRRRKSQRPASVLILKQANRLGKVGRKEFLQKMSLSSPDKKYDPVVPLLEEPSPIRHLRNRTTGIVLTHLSPKEDSDLKPEVRTSAIPCDLMDIAAIVSKDTTNRVQVVPKKTIKRKLFQDCRAANGAVNVPGPTVGSPAIERYKSPSGKSFPRRKRGYMRRDPSLLTKAFTCTICKDRSFEYKGNLVVHMKKHHAQTNIEPTPLPAATNSNDCVLPFSCPVCLQGFLSAFTCKSHLRKSHPDHVGWDPVNSESDNAVNVEMENRKQQPMRSVKKIQFKNNVKKILSKTNVKKNQTRNNVKQKPLSLKKVSSSETIPRAPATEKVPKPKAPSPMRAIRKRPFIYPTRASRRNKPDSQDSPIPAMEMEPSVTAVKSAVSDNDPPVLGQESATEPPKSPIIDEPSDSDPPVEPEPQCSQFNFRMGSGVNFTFDRLSLPPIHHISQLLKQQQQFRASQAAVK